MDEAGESRSNQLSLSAPIQAFPHLSISLPIHHLLLLSQTFTTTVSHFPRLPSSPLAFNNRHFFFTFHFLSFRSVFPMHHSFLFIFFLLFTIYYNPIVQFQQSFFVLSLVGDDDDDGIGVSKNCSNSKLLLKGMRYSELEVCSALLFICVALFCLIILLC